jgi:ketosteroid isomerase-like protein
MNERARVLEAVADGFNQHDLEAIMAFFADDATFDAPRGDAPHGTRYVGRAAIADGFRARFDGIPDVHYDVTANVVCGDRGFSQWLLTGTSKDGTRIEVRGCDLWEFRDERIVRKDSYWKIVEPLTR